MKAASGNDRAAISSAEAQAATAGGEPAEEAMGRRPGISGDGREVALAIFMIAVQVIAALLLVPWFGLLSFASLVGYGELVASEGMDFGGTVFNLLLAYPACAVPSILLAWVLFLWLKRPRWAAAVSTLPLAGACVALSLWTVAS